MREILDGHGVTSFASFGSPTDRSTLVPPVAVAK
jgi:hypothetical protein